MANIIVNGFTVGTSLQSVILQNDQGQSFPVEQLGHLKDLSSTQEASQVICTPTIYNGKRLHRNIYHDFSGELLFTRYNAALTQLILAIMQRFQTTGQETYWSIYGTIYNDVINTQDEYLYTNAVFDRHNAGKFMGTGEVENSLAFRSQELVLTGASGVG